MGQNQDDAYVSSSSTGGGTGGEIYLHLVAREFCAQIKV